MNEGYQAQMMSWLDRWVKKPKRILAVDISQEIVRVVHVDRSEGRCRLLHSAVAGLEKDFLSSGEALQAFLNDFVDQHAVATRDVVLSISDANALSVNCLALREDLRRDDLPGEAAAALVEDVLFDLSEAYMDWQDLRILEPKEDAADLPRERERTFVILKKDIVDFYLDILVRCRLNPVCVTTSSVSHGNILRGLFPQPSSCAVLDLDYKYSTLSLYLGGQLHFARTLPVSWERITQSLTEILVSDKGKIELTDEEGEEIKDTIGFPMPPYDENQEVRDNIQLKHIVSMLRPVLEVLVRELRFSFDYYSANLDVEAPTVLYLTGGGANLKNLDAYLSQELGIEVAFLQIPDGVGRAPLPSPVPVPPSAQPEDKKAHTAGDPPGGSGQRRHRIINALGSRRVLGEGEAAISGIPGLQTALGLHPVTGRAGGRGCDPLANQMMSAVGAALSDPRGVNLLPPEVKQQKVARMKQVAVRLVGFTVTAVVLILYLIICLQIRDYQTRAGAARMHLVVIKEIEDLSLLLRAKRDLVETIRSGRVPVDGILKILSVTIPGDIVLRRVVFQQGKGQVALEGTVTDAGQQAEESLAAFMQQLEATPFFSEATLVSIDGVRQLQQFRMVCDIAQ